MFHHQRLCEISKICKLSNFFIFVQPIQYSSSNIQHCKKYCHSPTSTDTCYDILTAYLVDGINSSLRAITKLGELRSHLYIVFESFVFMLIQRRKKDSYSFGQITVAHQYTSITKMEYRRRRLSILGWRNFGGQDSDSDQKSVYDHDQLIGPKINFSIGSYIFDHI